MNWADEFHRRIPASPQSRAFVDALPLNGRARRVLLRADVASLADIRKLDRRYFRREQECGKLTLAEIGALIGGWEDQESPQWRLSRERLLDMTQPEFEAEIAPRWTKHPALTLRHLIRGA
jgi:hypothetical protein